MLQKSKINQMVCMVSAIVLAYTVSVVLGTWRSQAQPQTIGVLKAVTNVGVNNPARNPAFTLLDNGDLLLWWRGTPVNENADKGVLLKYAQFLGREFVSSNEAVTGIKSYAGTVHIRAIPKSSSIAVCSTLVGERRWSFDTAIQVIQRDKATGSFTLQSQLHTRLPFKTEGFPTPNPQAYWDVASMDPPVPVRDEYIHPQLTISVSGNPWYLVGIEGEAVDTRGVDSSKMWFTKSLNKGISWSKRKMLNIGNQPFLVETSSKNLLLAYIQPPAGVHSSSQTLWPDDKLPGFPQEENWPVTGSLKMLHSKDEGRTWDGNQTVVNDELIVQSKACIGNNGEIWLTYVQSDSDLGVSKRTSLWLISSKNHGQTWSKPTQITDGKYLDREPDIIYHDGKLLIAFSRAGRGINTNIYVAEVEAD